MHLTFLTGLFWLLLASCAGETIVRTARALRGRDSAEDEPPLLKERMAALERRLDEQARAMEAQRVALDAHRQALATQEEVVARIEERSDFTERLLESRRDDRSPPRSDQR